jgi:hypothetical protein
MKKQQMEEKLIPLACNLELLLKTIIVREKELLA